MSVKENYICCDDKPEKGEMTKLESNECDKLMNACNHDEALIKDDDDKISLNKCEKESPTLLKNVSSPPQLYLNQFMNTPPNSITHIPNVSMAEPLLNRKPLSSSFSEDVRQRQTKKNELKAHKYSGQNMDFDEVNFKDLLNSKANLARTIVYHEKHRKKHKLKQKILEGSIIM